MSEQAPLGENDETDLALEWFSAMWDEAIKRGVSPQSLSLVILSASVSKLVDIFGEQSAAEMLETSRENVKSGGFSGAN